MKTAMIVIVAMALLAGCGKTTGKGASSGTPAPDGNVRAQQASPEPITKENRQAVTERLENLVKGIPHVKNATCVVVGHTAVVGIDVDGNMERSRVDTIKYSAAEALRKDPYGVNAFVTADMDLGDRLRAIREQIKNGHPVAGFAEELGKIIGRIIPQLPRDISPKQAPPAPKNENEQNFESTNL
ncbi:YhcN/YlaJ family sporulation lipoprotein [Paenibacillus sp. MBLB4367]|uniref:YhcN/YlaJ family sporulation lipoprotein n=1 Tax=Paenibacillus sp. MBLB4367 TaxID=3384767 RepID=UPI00390836AC